MLRAVPLVAHTVRAEDAGWVPGDLRHEVLAAPRTDLARDLGPHPLVLLRQPRDAGLVALQELARHLWMEYL